MKIRAALCVVLLMSLTGIPAQATVRNFTAWDGTSRTLYYIMVSGELQGAPPGAVDSIEIALNGEDLGYTRDDFTYSSMNYSTEGTPAHIAFFGMMVPGAARPGVYTFTLKSGEVSVTTFDTQTLNRTLPIPDTDSFVVSGNTFSWDPVSGSGGPIYYRLAIIDPDATTIPCNMGVTPLCYFKYPVYTNRTPGMTSYTIPDGTLTPGKTYLMEVDLCDAPTFFEEQNRTHSPRVEFIYTGEVGAIVEGTVRDAQSGWGVSGAQLLFSPGGYRVIADSAGVFSSMDVPVGVYAVEVSAPRYNTKTLFTPNLSAGVTHDLSTTLTPRAPQITALGADPSNVPSDGATTTLLTARVTHPDGPESISSVTVDLSAVGGAAGQSMYDNGTKGDAVAGDGTYSYRTTVATSSPARGYSLHVYAADEMGFTRAGTIRIDVIEKVTGSVDTSRSDYRTFINALEGQDLIISFSINHPTAGALFTRADSTCHVELIVYRPDGTVYGTYEVTDAVDITVKGAEPGEWRYETVNHCEHSVAYAIETKGGGTGMLVGRVMDAYSGLGLTGATVTCNTGGSTRTLTDGYFAGVAVAGNGAVITEATGYKTHVRTGVSIVTGGTTNLTIQLTPQSLMPQTAPVDRSFFEIMDPSEEPSPPRQPLAGKLSDEKFELNALFPPYQTAVSIYVGMIVDYPGMVGKLYLFDETNTSQERTKGLVAWREAVRAEQSGYVIPPTPMEKMRPANYIFFSVVTTDPTALSNFHMSYFTLTLGQPPPKGKTVKEVRDPSDTPVPADQPVAFDKVGDKWELNAYFPPQEKAVTIYLGYLFSQKPGKMFLFLPDNTETAYTGKLEPWRQGVTVKQSARIFSKRPGEMAPGNYTFFSLRTTDPAGLKSFDLIYFVVEIK